MYEGVVFLDERLSYKSNTWSGRYPKMFTVGCCGLLQVMQVYIYKNNE